LTDAADGKTDGQGRPAKKAYYAHKGTQETIWDAPLELQLVITEIYKMILSAHKAVGSTGFFIILSNAPSRTEAGFEDSGGGDEGGEDDEDEDEKGKGKGKDDKGKGKKGKKGKGKKGQATTGANLPWRCLLWYLKIQGECIDTLIFDPRGQGGDKNYHCRAPGFVGFDSRKDAEE
jgi:hypothetical protein